MKIRGAKEAVILISQSNDGTIGIAGGIFGSRVIRRVIFLYLYYWHAESYARNSPLGASFVLRRNQLELEVAATLRVSAIAIKFNGIAGAFTRGAAILPVLLWRASANRVLASLLFVCHKSSR